MEDVFEDVVVVSVVVVVEPLPPAAGLDFVDLFLRVIRFSAQIDGWMDG